MTDGTESPPRKPRPPHLGGACRGALFPPDMAAGPEDVSDGRCLSAAHFALWQALVEEARTRTGDTMQVRLALITGASASAVQKSLLRLAELGFIAPATDDRPLRVLLRPAPDAAPGLGRNGKPLKLRGCTPVNGREAAGARPATSGHRKKTISPGDPLGTVNIAPTWRACMSCGARFFSEGKHNRRCSPCRSGNSHTGYDESGFGGDGRARAGGEGPV